MPDDVITEAARAARLYATWFESLALLLECDELDDAEELLRDLKAGALAAEVGDWAHTTAALRAALEPRRQKANTDDLHAAALAALHGEKKVVN